MPATLPESPPPLQREPETARFHHRRTELGSRHPHKHLSAAHTPYADRNRIPSDVSLVFQAGIARATGGWDAVRRYVQLDDFFHLDWLHGEFVISQ
jgi:hypothetical protein